MVDALVLLVVARALRIQREVARRRRPSHQHDPCTVHRALAGVGVVDADQGLAGAAGREVQLVRLRSGPAEEGVEDQDAVAIGGGEGLVQPQRVADDAVREVDRPGRARGAVPEGRQSVDLEGLGGRFPRENLNDSRIGDRSAPCGVEAVGCGELPDAGVREGHRRGAEVVDEARDDAGLAVGDTSPAGQLDFPGDLTCVGDGDGVGRHVNRSPGAADHPTSLVGD